MRFSTAFVTLALFGSSIALPTSVAKRALTKQSYADFQISGGVAGNALAEVNAKFPINDADVANVSDADHQIIKDARQVAESAETDAFNPAISAAGSSSAAGKALQVGKIKNKVLKLRLEVLDLLISQAQGEDVADKITEEQTKLNNNIATDKKSAGQKSQSVQFDG